MIIGIPTLKSTNLFLIWITKATKDIGINTSKLMAWALFCLNDKNIVKKVALNRLKYVGRCKPSDILQGFNVTRVANKVSIFKPKTAEYLIEKYLSEATAVVDPFSGFSGRMLGAFNAGKKYIGWDINETHVKESNEIIKFKNIGNCCSTNGSIPSKALKVGTAVLFWSVSPEKRPPKQTSN